MRYYAITIKNIILSRLMLWEKREGDICVVLCTLTIIWRDSLTCRRELDMTGLKRTRSGSSVP